MVWRSLAIAVVLGSWVASHATAREPEYLPAPSGDLAERLDGTLGSFSGPSSHESIISSSMDGVYSEGMIQDGDLPICSSADRLRSALYMVGEGVVLHRLRAPKNGGQNRVLGEDITIPTQVTSINSANTEFNLAPGARITLGHYLDSECSPYDRSMEFTFLGFFNFSTHSELNGVGSHAIFTPLANYVGGFNGADVMTTRYHSDFNSFEWNFRFSHDLPRDQMVMSPEGDWRKELTKGRVMSLMLGIRWLSWDEDLEWLSRRNDQTVDVFRGDYNVKTRNDFVGAQVGAEMKDHHENWDWGVSLKGGIYANFASQDSDVQFKDSNVNLLSVDRHEHASKTIAALGGDIGIFGNYHINRRWTLHGGYDFMFLRGLADASKQIHFDNHPVSVVVGTYQILTGASIGLEMNW